MSVLNILVNKANLMHNFS